MSDDEPESDTVSTLDEAIDVLSQHDAAEVADRLPQPVYQEAYDDGHEAGLGEINRKYDKAQSEVEDLREQVEAKEQELQQLREESPDTDELYSQWEEQELQPVREELDSLRSRVKESSRKEAKREVIDRVADEIGDEFLAETVVERHRERINVTDNGEVEFLREGGNPYATRSDQNPADLFARDVVEQIPEPYRNQNQQGGPRSTEGTTENGQATSHNGTTRSELASSPSKMADFRRQFDSSEKFQEAYESLPEE